MPKPRNTISRFRWTSYAIGAVLLLAACSGNLSGGATPPVQPQAAGGAAPAGGGAAPQTHPESLNGIGGTPLVAVSREAEIGSMPTPIALPSAGGYGGTMVIAAATPVPSQSPIVDLNLDPMPSDAPTREPGDKKDKAVFPIVMLSLHTEDGDGNLVNGLKGLSFTIPVAPYKHARHFALGFFETNIPPGPRSLFGRHKNSPTALLALDDVTKLDASGHTSSQANTPISIVEDHQYSVVLYADHTAIPATPGPTPSSSPNPVMSKHGGAFAQPGSSGTPGASPSISPSSSASPAPTGSETPSVTISSSPVAP